MSMAMTMLTPSSTSASRLLSESEHDDADGGGATDPGCDAYAGRLASGDLPDDGPEHPPAVERQGPEAC